MPRNYAQEFSTSGKIDAVKTNYTWTINKFCSGCNEVGSYLLSPIFSVRAGKTEYNWQLKLYPKGAREQNKDFVSIFLVSHTSPHIKTPITVSYGCSLLDNHFEKVGHLFCQNGLFTQEANSFGFPNFVQRNFLVNEKNCVLINDELVVLCEIIIDEVIESVEKSKTLNISDVQEHFQRLEEFDSFEKMLNNKEFSDVTLRVKTKQFHAHRNVLTIKSPVFAAMFRLDMKEKRQSTVSINDIDCDVFGEFLRFVYAGKVEQIGKYANQLLKVADKYNVEGLKALCERNLSKNLNSDNVLEYLNLADFHGANSLKRESISFIASHGDEIIKKQKLQ